MAVLRASGYIYTQAGAASVATVLAMLFCVAVTSAEGSKACSSGIDVTGAPYKADPTGASDSSSAFNAAIVAAAGGGMSVYTFVCNRHLWQRIAFPSWTRRDL